MEESILPWFLLDSSVVLLGFLGSSWALRRWRGGSSDLLGWTLLALSLGGIGLSQGTRPPIVEGAVLGALLALSLSLPLPSSSRRWSVGSSLSCLLAAAWLWGKGVGTSGEGLPLYLATLAGSLGPLGGLLFPSLQRPSDPIPLYALALVGLGCAGLYAPPDARIVLGRSALVPSFAILSAFAESRRGKTSSEGSCSSIPSTTPTPESP